MVANRRSIVCLDASAIRFQWVHTALVAATAATTSAAIASIAARGTSSAVSGAPPAPRSVAAHAVASAPSRSDARRRHSAVRSASDRSSFGGRVARVAWARSSTIVFADGIRPCRATYSAMSSSFSSSISRVRLENSAISSSLTPAISHCGLRSAPRCRTFPLDAEVAGEPVGQQRVVVRRQPRHGGEDRAAVEAAPATVHHGQHLVGDDHVGVELRVSGARVVVVVGDGGDSGDADLGHGAVAVGDAGPGGGDLALEEVEHVGDRRVMRLRDPLLGGRVGDSPQHRHRLRDAEGEVEARHRLAHAGSGLLGFDPARFGRAVLLRHLRIESGDALLDAVRQALVRRVGTPELLARDRVAAHADQQRELLLGDLHARSELAAPQGPEPGAQPAARRRTDLGVVAGERRRQRSVAVTGGDAAQQVLVAAARGHPAQRDRHGRFPSTVLRCAQSIHRPLDLQTV